MSLLFWAALAAAILIAALVMLLVQRADAGPDMAPDSDALPTEFDLSCSRFGYIQDARNRGEM